MDAVFLVTLILVFAGLSFTLSASAGMGGSLILIPALSLLLGPKQGIALAALLLACNNVAKIVAYRATIPWRAVITVLAPILLGTIIGARLLLAAPESWVNFAVIASIGSTFLFERFGPHKPQKVSASVLAFGTGAVSGFSGTSGPLKALALRSLVLDRLCFVGAASVISFAGDAIKTAIFTRASILDQSSWLIALAAMPFMPLATFAGRHLNKKIGERAFAGLFWAVMMGYSVRLFLL
jgi:hypothetical protein